MIFKCRITAELLELGGESLALVVQPASIATIFTPFNSIKHKNYLCSRTLLPAAHTKLISSRMQGLRCGSLQSAALLTVRVAATTNPSLQGCLSDGRILDGTNSAAFPWLPEREQKTTVGVAVGQQSKSSIALHLFANLL